MKDLKTLATGLIASGYLLAAGTVHAQVDLSGNWQGTGESSNLDLVPNGPPAGDFLGIPLNDNGRAMAETVDTSQQEEELYRQCETWGINYFIGSGVDITPVFDPTSANSDDVVAWHLSGQEARPPLTVWMDGRSAPSPLALHTDAGYATGKWLGNTLVVSITHLSAGFWMLRNGTPQSNQTTMTWFLTREGNLLTVTYVTRDPVYLSEPYPRAFTLRLTDNDLGRSGGGQLCLPANVIPGLSDGHHAARFLPWAAKDQDNPNLTYMMTSYGIPLQVAHGGAEEMYPWYQKTLDKVYKTPAGYCTSYCLGNDQFNRNQLGRGGGPPGAQQGAGAD